jgi:hypothetical protein
MADYVFGWVYVPKLIDYPSANYNSTHTQDTTIVTSAHTVG